jgi:hypothetical protein
MSGQRPPRQAATVPALALLAVIILIHPATAERRIAFKIPAQDLNGAILFFADEAGIQVFHDVSRVQGLRSNGATGNLTLQDALGRIFDGTGLTFRFRHSVSGLRCGCPAPYSNAPLRPSSTLLCFLQREGITKAKTEGRHKDRRGHMVGFRHATMQQAGKPPAKDITLPRSHTSSGHCTRTAHTATNPNATPATLI